jgi:hypothetical protein
MPPPLSDKSKHSQIDLELPRSIAYCRHTVDELQSILLTLYRRNI